MSEIPTPETDAFILSQDYSPTGHQWRNFTRQLERERDEVKEKLADWENSAAHVEEDYPDEKHCACVPVLRKLLADARKERDEAREVASGLSIQEERVNEAQKELSSIHRWIDRNHPDGFIDSLTYLQNLERVTDNWYDRLDRLEVDAKRFVRERDEAIFSKNTSAADFLKQIRQITLCKDVAREKLLMAEKERDETRKQFVDFLNKTEDYKRERDEARHKLELCMAANSDVARIAKERDEAITRRMETIMQCELYEQERDEAREQVKELIYIAERAIVLAEIDFENDKFGVVSELWDGLERIKEGAK